MAVHAQYNFVAAVLKSFVSGVIAYRGAGDIFNLLYFAIRMIERIADLYKSDFMVLVFVHFVKPPALVYNIPRLFSARPVSQRDRYSRRF